MNRDIVPIYELLKDEKRWTKHSIAVDAGGVPVMASDERACCWCLLGAIIKSYPDGDRRRGDVHSMLLQALPEGIGSVSNFNDRSTHEEVLKFLEGLQ